MANIVHSIDICKKHWAFSTPGSSPFWAGSGGQHLPAPGLFHGMEGRGAITPRHSWHPQKFFFFFMGPEKIAFSQPFYWQYHRITECFGLERILKMIQGLTVVGGIPSFQGTLSRIISIFYEPQSCSSTAGVFYFLLLYLFSFTS